MGCTLAGGEDNYIAASSPYTSQGASFSFPVKGGAAEEKIQALRSFLSFQPGLLSNIHHPLSQVSLMSPLPSVGLPREGPSLSRGDALSGSLGLLPQQGGALQGPLLARVLGPHVTQEWSLETEEHCPQLLPMDYKLRTAVPTNILR